MPLQHYADDSVLHENRLVKTFHIIEQNKRFVLF